MYQTKPELVTVLKQQNFPRCDHRLSNDAAFEIEKWLLEKEILELKKKNESLQSMVSVKTEPPKKKLYDKERYESFIADLESILEKHDVSMYCNYDGNIIVDGEYDGNIFVVNEIEVKGGK